jgi:hypothetical protein
MTTRLVPNLLVPGMQKSGTTFLCVHLARHPEIYFSRDKEPNFFGRRRIDARKFEQYQDRVFPAADVSVTKGQPRYLAEGTTTYFQKPEALENILQYVGGDIKAIVCLRHPIEKAVSHYLHNWRRKRLVGTERIIDIDGAVRSVYEWTLCASHAKRWISALGREHLLFLRYELLCESPAAYVRAATDFLGIEPLARVETRKINMGFALRRENGALVPVVSGARAEEGRPLPSFRLSDLEFLMDYFRPDVERTEEIIGMELSSWKVLPKMAN